MKYAIFYSKNVSRRRKRCRTSENSSPLYKHTNLNINQLSFPNAGRRDVVLSTGLATSKKRVGSIHGSHGAQWLLVLMAQIRKDICWESCGLPWIIGWSLWEQIAGPDGTTGLEDQQGTAYVLKKLQWCLTHSPCILN